MCRSGPRQGFLAGHTHLPVICFGGGRGTHETMALAETREEKKILLFLTLPQTPSPLAGELNRILGCPTGIDQLLFWLPWKVFQSVPQHALCFSPLEGSEPVRLHPSAMGPSAFKVSWSLSSSCEAGLQPVLKVQPLEPMEMRLEDPPSLEGISQHGSWINQSKKAREKECPRWIYHLLVTLSPK